MELGGGFPQLLRKGDVGQGPGGEYGPPCDGQVSVLRGEEMAAVLSQHFTAVLQILRKGSKCLSGMVSCFGTGV